MLLNLLTALPEGGRMIEIPEALLYALIGFLVVFLGIAFLITVVWTVGKVMNIKNTSTTPAPQQSVEKVVSTPKAETEVIDEETVAVIMAALMAYYETNNPKCEFRVKRIKRI